MSENFTELKRLFDEEYRKSPYYEDFDDADAIGATIAELLDGRELSSVHRILHLAWQCAKTEVRFSTPKD